MSFLFAILDLYSTGPNFDDMLLLETELPDELMAGGPSSWEQQMVTNKPPAQGPGPGQIYNTTQMNGGDDAIVPPSVLQRQQHQQQLAHLLQQGQKNPMVGNPHLNQLTNKSQGGPNVTAVMNNLAGVGNMTMSMAPNNGTNNAMTMQGKLTFQFMFSLCCVWKNLRASSNFW